MNFIELKNTLSTALKYTKCQVAGILLRTPRCELYSDPTYTLVGGEGNIPSQEPHRASRPWMDKLSWQPWWRSLPR